MSAELALTALSHLRERGQQVTFRRVGRNTYDPSTGQASVTSNDDETAIVAFVNYKEESIDGETVQRGDRLAVMSALDNSGNALGKEPRTDDQIIGEADKVSIVSVQKIRPGGTTIAYLCQVRE